MAIVIIRMWTEKEYSKDIVIMDEDQVRMRYVGTEPSGRHIKQPIDAIRVVIDPKQFPEAIEFEVIVKR
jgi:hypothetical protein